MGGNKVLFFSLSSKASTEFKDIQGTETFLL